MVRKVLYDEYGNSIYTSGLKVITTIKKKNQRFANKAVEKGIINYMNRQPLRIPEGFVSLNDTRLHDKKTKKQFLRKFFYKKFKELVM